MANRYANLVGSKKISEDFNNINIGFDRVQTEMDTKGTPADAQVKADAAKQAAIDTAAAALTAHKQRGADEHPTAKGNAAGFMSAADKLKSDASTNAATPDTLMQRDAAGRAKVAAPAAADDIARKAETDAVQGNLDSHAADTDIHVTAEDHEKLDSIAEGAEVNQNAFAKVNDVVASDPSDVVTFVGGTGIVVSTNPMTNEIMLTATSEATPGAHASSHITGGSDVIPDAVTGGSSGLMSGADAKFVRQDGETKAGAQAKADAAEEAAKEYTDNQVEVITDRLDTPERAAITLQPGVRVVQASQDAAFKLAGLQGRTVLNYQSQIGIYGVLNPYVIRYGENLLPPFYEWPSTPEISVINAYELKLTPTVTRVFSITLPVVPGSTYTLSAEHNGNIALSIFNANNQELASSGYSTAGQVTLTAPTASNYMRVYFSNLSVTSGVFNFKNPMLNIGNVALPFVQREDSMLALQTELHANPDTGANPDSVFERDGQYLKLAKWRKASLDAALTYTLWGSATGFKVVNAMLPGPPAVDGSGVLTKYQAKVIKETDYATVNSAPDNLNIGSSGANGVFDNFQISIANTDSGWGDNYTNLTSDEIKAYFMGWRMAENVTGFPAYNGTGTKCWFGIKSLSAPTTTLPTTPDVGYNPYQLLYQLATPVVEPITSEGQLTFNDGANQVEVGTGIVLREGIKPSFYSGLNRYYINISGHPNVPSAPLKNKTNNIIQVFKNSSRDKWERFNDAYGYGGQYAYIQGSQYDPSAAYSVTYLMLDKYPAVDITGTYAENEKALLLDTVKTLQENTTRISVLESKKAEKDSPAWIAPTLLNGWANFNVTTHLSAGYILNNGYVTIQGIVKSGAIGQPILKLPTGYRPKLSLVFATVASSSGSLVPAQLTVSANGDVILFVGGNEWASLNITFKVD